MFWEVLLEDSDRIVIKTKTFEKKTIRFHLINEPGSNTIGVNYIDGIPLGSFDSKIKKKALKMNAWDAIITHEVMHLYPEFTVQWYSTLDVLPEKFENNVKRIIPNIFEDVVINQTLFRWEISPIRAGKDFQKPNIVENLISFAKDVRRTSYLPPPIESIRELINRVHMRLLENMLSQAKHKEKKDNPRVDIKGRVFCEIPKLLKNLNYLINSNAISLYFKGRIIVCNLKIFNKDGKNPLFETKCNGDIIPQYVRPDPSYINSIYDCLDVHFANVYDIKVKKLRKESYNNYKKIIKSNKNKSKKLKYFSLKPRVYVKDSKLTFDFSLKTSVKKTGSIPKRISFGSDLGIMNIETGEMLENWERFNSIKMSELMRLKKWIS